MWNCGEKASAGHSANYFLPPFLFKKFTARMRRRRSVANCHNIVHLFWAHFVVFLCSLNFTKRISTRSCTTRHRMLAKSHGMRDKFQNNNFNFFWNWNTSSFGLVLRGAIKIVVNSRAYCMKLITTEMPTKRSIDSGIKKCLKMDFLLRPRNPSNENVGTHSK
jgi:hypothetical protein